MNGSVSQYLIENASATSVVSEVSTSLLWWLPTKFDFLFEIVFKMIFEPTKAYEFNNIIHILSKVIL